MTSSNQPPSSPDPSDESDAKALESSELAIDLAVISSLRQLYPESNGGPINDLVRAFLVNAQGHLHQIKEAADEGDLERIERAAHTLRGSSGTLGARRLSKLCHQIEVEARDHERTAPAELIAALPEEFQRVERAFRGAISHESESA